jgi:hypothetical protein
MKLTERQSEAIIWAMFAAENEIESLTRALIESGNNQEKTFYESILIKRQEHWRALNELIMNSKNIS